MKALLLKFKMHLMVAGLASLLTIIGTLGYQLYGANKEIRLLEGNAVTMENAYNNCSAVRDEHMITISSLETALSGIVADTGEITDTFGEINREWADLTCTPKTVYVPIKRDENNEIIEIDESLLVAPDLRPHFRLLERAYCNAAGNCGQDNP